MSETTKRSAFSWLTSIRRHYSNRFNLSPIRGTQEPIMTANDFSARDCAVKHNVYASVRRRDGVPQELFATYWRDVHATLCSRLPGLGFYVQQHFDRTHTANLWPLAHGVRPIRAVLDGSAELGFASLD